MAWRPSGKTAVHLLSPLCQCVYCITHEFLSVCVFLSVCCLYLLLCTAIDPCSVSYLITIQQPTVAWLNVSVICVMMLLLMLQLAVQISLINLQGSCQSTSTLKFAQIQLYFSFQNQRWICYLAICHISSSSPNANFFTSTFRLCPTRVHPSLL